MHSNNEYVIFKSKGLKPNKNRTVKRNYLELQL